MDLDGMPDVFDCWPDGPEGELNTKGLIPTGFNPALLQSLLAYYGVIVDPPSDLIQPTEALDRNGDGLLTIAEALTSWGTEIALELSSFVDGLKGQSGTPQDNAQALAQAMGFVKTLGAIVEGIGNAAPEVLGTDFGKALVELASMGPQIAEKLEIVSAVAAGEILIAASGSSFLTCKFIPHPDGSPGIDMEIRDANGSLIDPESLGSSNPFANVAAFLNATVGDPVDTASGELIYEVDDISVPGRGLDFVLKRHYGSRSVGIGILGHNWSIPLVETYALTFSGANSIAVVWGDGTSARYELDSASGLYIGSHGEFGKIRIGFEDGDPDAAVQAPGLVLRKPDGMTYHFCFPAAVAGMGTGGVSFLKKVSDPNGNALVFERNEWGNATKITDTLGYVVTLTYDPVTGLLSEVQDAAGRAINYFYDDEKQQLLRVERPAQPVMQGGTVLMIRPAENYTYWDHPSGWADNKDHSLNHNLQSITEDGSSSAKLFVSYFTSFGYSFDKVATQEIDGHTTRYRYQELGVGTALGADPYQPSADHVTEVLFDSGTLQRFIHKEGVLLRDETVNGIHDSAFQFVGGGYTNEDEAVTHGKWFKIYEYDDDYRLLRTAQSTDQVWPIARDFVYAYDSTNPDRFQQRNVQSITERPSTPGAGIPDPIAGFPQKRTDFTYDPVTARPVEAIDHVGRVWTYSYAHLEHAYEDVQDWPGLAPWGILPDEPPASMLDLFGLGDVNGDGLQAGLQELVKRSDPEVVVADSDGPGAGTQLQRPEQLAQFNAHGDVTRFRGVSGAWTDISYMGGRATRVDDDPTGIGRIQRIGYDSVGRPAWQWDTQNHLALVTYNANGQPIEYRQSPVHVHSATHCLYGGACLQSPSGDPGDLARQLYYDERGNVVAETSSNYATAEAGDPTQGPYGPIVRQWAYDSTNRVSSVTQTTHGLNGTATGSAAWQMEYDGEGREWQVTLPDGAVTTNFRDARGLVIRQEFEKANGDPLGFQEYDFDAFGDIVASTDAFGNRTTVERDGFGRPHKLTTPEGIEFRITLDSIDRVTVDQTWDGPTKVAEKRHQYDDGNRVLHTEIDNYTIAHDGTVSLGTPATYVTEKGWGLRPSECVWDVASPGANPVITRRYFDDLGRLEAEYQGATNVVGETYQYDEEGRLLTRTVKNDDLGTTGGVSPSESVWQYHYDRFSRLAHVIDPNGNSTVTVNGPGNLPEKVSNANGNYTTFARDSLGNPIFQLEYDVQGALLRTLVTSYDAQGRIKVRSDGKGNQTSYTYDELGRHFKRTFLDTSSIQHNYDLASRLQSIDNPGGVSWVYGYDDDGILTSVTTSGPAANVSRSFGNDALGRVLTCSEAVAGQPATSVRRTLDALGNIVEEGVSVGGASWTTMNSSYSTAALRESIGWPSGRNATYGYDALGRLTTVAGSTSGQIASFEDYWGTMRARSINLLSEARIAREFDPAGRALVSKATTGIGTILSGLSYQYDAVGNLEDRTRLTDNLIEEFDYDALDRLKEWRFGVQVGLPSDRTVAWTWDNADNLDLYSDTAGAGTLDSAVNYLNQQTSLTPPLTSIGWTARGEESSRTGTAGSQAFVWDALGRPISSQFLSGGSPVTVYWLFDGFGRLLERTDSLRGTVAYAWLGATLVQTDSSSSGLVEVIPGSGSVPLARIWNGQGPSYYHVEATGNVLGIFSPTTLLEAYEYEPFGDVRNAITGQPLTASAVSNELLFGAAPHDLSQKWVHFGARMYDAGLGRFASRDPLGEEAGQNLYSYAFANPLRYSDRTGLAPSENQSPAEVGSLSGPPLGLGGRESGSVLMSGVPIDIIDNYLQRNGGSMEEVLTASTAVKFGLASVVAQALGVEGTDWGSFESLSPAQMFGALTAANHLMDFSVDGLGAEEAMAVKEFQTWARDGINALGASLALSNTSSFLDIPEVATSVALEGLGMSHSSAEFTSTALWFAVSAPKAGMSIGYTIAAAAKRGAVRALGKLGPDSRASGPHSVFKQDQGGKVTKYETFKPQSNPLNPNPWESTGRFDGAGKGHFNKATGQDIPTPHMHDPAAPGGIRIPTLNELPKGYK